MPLPLQATLLRILETRSFVRVGGESETPFDIRVIASTNRDPLTAVHEGRFRADLYYRLSEFLIAVPPLRARGDDVVLLTESFVAEFNERHGPRRRVASADLQQLRTYPWPGNVRELRHVIQRHYILDDDVQGLRIPLRPGNGNAVDLLLRPGMSIAEMEQRLIHITLEHFCGDKKRSADALGISLRTLYNRLHEYSAVTA
jgi:transcriptional regulator with PAS, ATPase and Fis domain